MTSDARDRDLPKGRGILGRDNSAEAASDPVSNRRPARQPPSAVSQLSTKQIVRLGAHNTSSSWGDETDTSCACARVVTRNRGGTCGLFTMLCGC